MSYKERDNYTVGTCFKECLNRDKKCNTCIRFSNHLIITPIATHHKEDKKEQ